jgi:hypothetical protein
VAAEAAPPEEPARIEVTAKDLGTGDSQTVVITDNYVVTCAGSAYVDHVQAYANGTHVITVKGAKRK